MEAAGNSQPIFRTQASRRGAFTLVELLVVIAIIGVLVALLLPAVQAAREAARRTQCSNQIRQIGLASQNHVDAQKVFPTGGTAPHPKIEDFMVNGRPRSAERQGLGWGYQLLPYLEQGAIHNITTREQLEKTPVNLYFCPSRRAPTQGLSSSTADGSGGETFRWLSDYAGVTAVSMLAYVRNDEAHFWGTAVADGKHIWSVLPEQEFWGVIVRTPWNPLASGSTPVGPVSIARPTEPQHIEDGLSNVMLVGEKRIHPRDYAGHGADDGTAQWYDDRGWSDGWDADTMRSAAYDFGPDGDTPDLSSRQFGFTFGSAHSGGMNVVYADASVHFIQYDVDPVAFNRMGHRSDGQQLTDPVPQIPRPRL